MKQNEESFEVYAGKRPKVLLLGNGVNRAYDGFSWDDLLDSMKQDWRFPLPSRQYRMPMSLKAAMLSGNWIGAKLANMLSGKPLPEEAKEPDDDSKLERKKIKWAYFVTCTDDQGEYLRKLLGLGFDYVLTTNYDYSLETALLKYQPSKGTISRLTQYYELNRAEPKYLMHTFNQIDVGSRQHRIWHIHGEARKPSSLILEHSGYGSLLSRCCARADRMFQNCRENLKAGQPQKIGSWVDAFLLGDVYVLGLGMDFSEIDLWWLLGRKANRQGSLYGKTVFYSRAPLASMQDFCSLDPKKQCDFAKDFVQEQACSKLLMATYGVEQRELNSPSFQAFYEAAFENLKKEL